MPVFRECGHDVQPMYCKTCEVDEQGRQMAELEAKLEAALEYVTDSYRPTPKYDAARFDRLCEALGYKHCGTQSGDDLIEED